MPNENNDEQVNLKEDIHSCLKVIDSILDDFWDVCEQEDPEAEKFVRDMATKYGFTELIHEQSN